jgi:hypothetical protein
MEENLALYYTAEALACVEAVHKRGIVHCAITTDSLLLRYGDSEEDWPEWVPNEAAATSGSSWAGRGLTLELDPECAVDARSLPPKPAKVVAPWPERLRWAQEDSSRSWLWGVDVLGLCNVIHALVFDGAQLEWIAESDKTAVDVTRAHRRLVQPLRKTWRAGGIWSGLFDTLLNADPEAETIGVLARLRQTIESYLASDIRRAKSIKMLMIRQQIMHQEMTL